MNRQEFDALVRRIAARYDGRSEALARSSAVWVGLGLAGILAWIVFCLASGGAAFALGVMLPGGLGVPVIGLGAFLIVYGLSQAVVFMGVDAGTPNGRALRKNEAPALTALLDDLRHRLRCRPFDEVRVSLAFNAGVREVPRLGFLGWPRTTLELGVPLLETLSPDELRAVLAHEFAHHSARHGRGSGRIYRLHRAWGTLFERLQTPPKGSFDRWVRWSSSRFADWYWPRFHARAFVLSRSQEYRADHDAADVAGSEALVAALWRIECQGARIAEEFWPGLHRRAAQEPEPPADILRLLKTALGSAPSPQDASRWAARGLSRLTGLDDTHPAFLDRARALDRSVDGLRSLAFPEPIQASSAEVFLGRDLGPIASELSDRWRLEARASWRDRHRRAVAESRRDLEGAAETSEDRRSQKAELDAVSLWESAWRSAELGRIAEAEPILRRVLERVPNHAGAAVLLGQHRLSVGDPEGERLLCDVVDQNDERWLPAACAVLQEHYRAHAQGDRLAEIRARLDRHEEAVAASFRERSIVKPRDPMEPHGLDAEQLEPLRRVLESDSGCATAWLVRKALRHFPERPLLILCVAGEGPRWRSGRDRDLARRLVPRVVLPGQVLVIARPGEFRSLARRVMALPDSLIYQRGTGEGSPDPPMTA